MTGETPRAPRQRVLKGAKIVIRDGFSTIDCMVRNLSETGALIKVASVIGIPDSFRLVLSDGRSFQCIVAWKREAEVGVSFSQ